MRDDLHKAAPISKALQKLLQMCGRAADRADPARLRECALAPLVAEIARSLPQGAAEHYADEHESPGLFSRRFDGPVVSAFQSDLNAEFQANPTAAAIENFTQALNRSIEGMCNESAAAMIAAGGNRREVAETVATFRDVANAATPDAALSYLNGEKPPRPAKSLSLDATIAPGARA